MNTNSNNRESKECKKFEEKKCVQSILDYENFELSDSDDDEEYKTIINENKHVLNDLELKYFPEPYNFLGEFIISAIVGAYTIYLINIKNKKVMEENEYNDYLDVYFKYCSKTTNDNYITDLCSHLNLKANDKQYVSIIEKSNKLCKNIMDKLVKLNLSDKLSEIEVSDKFNLELFNLVVPFVKFNDINECLL